jgi:hypothetical protein
MIVDAVRSLWTEPRAPGSTSPRWPDWLATAVLAVLAIVEGVLRDDLERPAVAVAFGLALLLLLPWRRARPLVVAVSVFFALKAFDLVTVAAGGDPDQSLLWQNVWVLALPFALLRWGSGRQIALGSVVMAIVPLTGHSLADAVFATGRRRGTSSWTRCGLREREQLARELHDSVAHHVSAIAIQAQAGRSSRRRTPARAVEALEAIEEAASRTLGEMRAMVGVLRDGEFGEVELTRRGASRHRTARPSDGDGPRVDVTLTGDLDDLSAGGWRGGLPSGAGVGHQRVRHARTRPRRGPGRRRGECVRLTVHDDGEVRRCARPPATASSG